MYQCQWVHNQVEHGLKEGEMTNIKNELHEDLCLGMESVGKNNKILPDTSWINLWVQIDGYKEQWLEKIQVGHIIGKRKYRKPGGEPPPCHQCMFALLHVDN